MPAEPIGETGIFTHTAARRLSLLVGLVATTSGCFRGQFRIRLGECDAGSERRTRYGSCQATDPGDAPFTFDWTFNALESALYNFNSSLIQFASGVAELIGTDQTDDSSTKFSASSGAQLTGVISGTLSDGSSGLKLGDAGSCNGSSTNCAELDASWTPKYSSLVGYWKLDGNWADSKGTNNGTAVGSPGFSSAAKIGAHAGSFDGSGMRATYSDATLPSANDPRSIMMWIKTTSQNVIAVHYGDMSDGQNYIGVYDLNGQGQNAIIGRTGINLSGTSAIDDDNWHLVVGTYDGTTWKIYVDGVLENSDSSFTADTDLIGTMSIGAGSDSSQAVNGLIDDVAIWNAELTDADVKTIYARQSARYSGTFTSRVMDAGTSGASWTTLSWLPTLPFLKELPNYTGGSMQNETSTNYTSLVGSTGATGANDLMTGIIGLWHLNETTFGSASGGKDFKDDSGNSRHGVTNGGSVGLGQTGKLGRSVRFDGSGPHIAVDDSDAFTPAGDFTISAWVVMNTSNPNWWEAAFVGHDEGSGSTNKWIFSYDSTSSKTVFHVNDTSGTGPVYESDVWNMTLGLWHHIVVQREGTTYKFYWNGVQNGSAADTFPIPNAAAPVTIGFAEGSATLNGSIDEVAIWRRALHANEVTQLYQRGASRLKYQVRSCNDSTCSGDIWQGPDGTSGSYFSELNNNTLPLAQTGDVKPELPSLLFSNFTSPPSTNRYFQYRAIFETDSTDVALGPQLKNTTIDPTHYDKSSPTIIGKTGAPFYKLSSFAETLGSKGCSSGVRYNLALSDAGPWKYWDGNSWQPADGTDANANTQAQLTAHSNAALTAFGSFVGQGSVYFKAFLRSSGTSKCELDNIQIGGSK